MDKACISNSLGRTSQFLLAVAVATAGVNARSAVTATDIDSFDVRGNSLLSADMQEKALGPLPARLSLDEMKAAAGRLQQAYRSAGYGAVVVVLPEQALDTRILRLDVVEGKLRQVTITGHQNFSRDNIVRSLPALQIGQTPLLTALDQQLLMGNENPAKSTRVVLQPGQNPGDVEALVVVEEQPPQRWQLGLDNSGTPETGRYRATLSYQNANLADRDAVLGLRVSTSPTHPSRVAVFGSTLRVPIYRNNIAIEGAVLASNTRSATNATPAGDLRFSGTGLSVGARAVWTLASLNEVKKQAALGLDARAYRSECTLGAFGAAGCGNADNTVHVLPLTLSLTAQKLGTMFVSAQAVVNLPVGRAGRNADFNASRPGARAAYQLLRLNANAQQRLAPQWQLSWRADAQLAPRALVSAEQFGATGMYSVRGYEERALAGDSGAAVSVDLRTRLDTLIGTPSNASPLLAAFVDVGGVKNRLGTNCMPGRASCSVWSAGVGLATAIGSSSQLRLDIARAGTTLQKTQRGDWKAHISLTYSH